jgi:hypothetical protein
MQEGAGRHAELTEWQEDLWQRHTGSRVVLVQVPAGWGRTTVLDQFEAQIAAREDAPVTIPIRIGGQNLPGEAALQAQALRDLLAPAVERQRAAELLGLDRVGGAVQLGLGAAGLFFSGLTAGLSFLVAGLAVGAAGKAWDDSPAGQDGALARAAREVAAVSVALPVVVILDDADSVDHGLAVTLAENLAARHDGQVLIIAIVNPCSSLAAALTDRSRFGLTEGLVHAAEADPDMGYQSRLGPARQLCPHLPDAAVRRIAQRTATFAEVFRVAAAPRLADLGQGDGGVLAVVDAAVDARLARLVPSREATVLAWAGGLAHARQAERALGILGAPRFDDDPDVRRLAVVGGRDVGQGVGRVVDCGQDRGKSVGVGGKVGGLTGEACVAAGGCPSRVAVGEPADPQDQVADLGSYRTHAGAFMDSGAEEVPFVGDRPPGGAGECQGPGAVVELRLDRGVKPETGSAPRETADDDFAAVSRDR